MIKIWDLPVNEKDAVTYFQNYGIIPSKKTCLNRHEMSLYVKTDEQWRCNVSGCDERVGIRKDTWFEDLRLPFLTALRFIYSWSKELTSIEWGKEQLDMADKTTIDWNNYMREVCTHTLLQRPKIKIGGPNKIVEIDGSLFSKRKNHAGRFLPQQWIFGGICKETEECFIVKVRDRTAATLMAEIKNYIEDGSIIHSDSWKAYKSRELKAAGFKHFKVKHRYNFVDNSSGAHIQNFGRMWGSAKWRNKRERGTAREHLDSYLSEFMWRRLHKDDDMFIVILKGIKELSPFISSSSGTVAKEVEKKDPIPIEPTVEIKEEPADYTSNPSTSSNTTNDEFILPHEENSWAASDSAVEPQFTLSVASLATPDGPEISDGEQLRKKRKTMPTKITTLNTFVPPATNGVEVRPQSPVYNFGEFSTPSSSKESRKDQFDVFGEYIAAKLRSLDRRSCAFAQKAIGDIIFEAEMGKYLKGDLNQPQISRS